MQYSHLAKSHFIWGLHNTGQKRMAVYIVLHFMYSYCIRFPAASMLQRCICLLCFSFLFKRMAGEQKSLTSSPGEWGIFSETCFVLCEFTGVPTLCGDCAHLNQSFVFRKCDVVNRGLSGYNSRWAKILLPRLISSPNSADTEIAAVTLFFGANDCSLEGTVQLRDLLSRITEFIFAHRCFYNKNDSYTTFLLLLHR